MDSASSKIFESDLSGWHNKEVNTSYGYLDLSCEMTAKAARLISLSFIDDCSICRHIALIIIDTLLLCFPIRGSSSMALRLVTIISNKSAFSLGILVTVDI